MSNSNEYTMKWHFIKPILFIMGGLSNIGTGISYISGIIYNKLAYLPEAVYETKRHPLDEIHPEDVYGIYGGALKAIDISYGLVTVALAIIQIYICVLLFKMWMNSPKMFTLAYCVGLVVNLVYNITAACIMSEYMNIIMSTISFIMCSIFARLDYIYYKKRDFMFIEY